MYLIQYHCVSCNELKHALSEDGVNPTLALGYHSKFEPAIGSFRCGNYVRDCLFVDARALTKLIPILEEIQKWQAT